MLRDLPDSMDKSVVAQIEARLSTIRREHHVNIPLAVESGSRAWGFPSPDSDYDCRFIYIQPESEYLSLWPKRDVIETPLDPVLDVNGWDFGKAIKLLLKGNATVVEWLTSPISYNIDTKFKASFIALARDVTDRSLIAKHYLHLGERQRWTYFRDSKPISQKKIFYALRPATALRWLRHHPSDAVAPMHFLTLMAESAVPNDVADMVQTLIARKAQTRELGTGLLPESIRDFIDAEFEYARKSFDGPAVSISQEARQRCNDFFLTTIRNSPKIFNERESAVDAHAYRDL